MTGMAADSTIRKRSLQHWFFIGGCDSDFCDDQGHRKPVSGTKATQELRNNEEDVLDEEVGVLSLSACGGCWAF